jgi:hypothetical protein
MAFDDERGEDGVDVPGVGSLKSGNEGEGPLRRRDARDPDRSVRRFDHVVLRVGSRYHGGNEEMPHGTRRGAEVGQRRASFGVGHDQRRAYVEAVERR